MAFTEFYCQTTGSNLNAGSTTDDAAIYTATNGGWDSTTGVFTPASGNPSATVSVGMFASVYIDGATVGVFVGRVTAVDATTITVSTTAKSGTAPTTNANARTIKVGGAWKGPNGADTWPFSVMAATMTNAAGDTPRINIKNGVTYSITAAMTQSVAGPVLFQGYTSTPGDGGKATIDGGATGASFVLLTFSAFNLSAGDLIFQNNGDSGTSNLVTASSGESDFSRCVFAHGRGSGLSVNSGSMVWECEAFDCSQSGTGAGFITTASASCFRRCISHDNSGGASSHGFTVAQGVTCENCIADSNAGSGFSVSSSTGCFLIGCDSYNNSADGVTLSAGSASVSAIENCNFVKNGGWGINGSGGGARNGAVINCGFGSGTQANTSGTTTGLKSMVESGSVTYPADVTPWAKPGSGDFRVVLPQARSAGRGSYTQTQSGYSGTSASPSIGAAQQAPSYVIGRQLRGRFGRFFIGKVSGQLAQP